MTDILQAILVNLQDIVRSEVRLVKTAIKTDVGETARAGKSVMVGTVLALYAGGLLLLAVVHGLSLFVQPWIAALAVGGLISVIAAILINIGRAQLRIVHSRPDSIIENTKETVHG